MLSFSQPPRLISPDTLLKRRAGNSFEMATLLCSLLIANRYGAMVVSGSASREVTNNDLQRVTCPDTPIQSSQQQTQVCRFRISNTVSLKMKKKIFPIGRRKSSGSIRCKTGKQVFIT